MGFNFLQCFIIFEFLIRKLEMEIRNLKWQFLFVIIVVGCTTQSKFQMPGQSFMTGTVLPPTSANTLVTLASPLLPSIMTATPAYTSTIVLTNTPIPKTATSILQKCLQVRSSLSKNKSYQGKIVFIGNEVVPPGGNLEKDTYRAITFYDFKTGQSKPILQYKPSNIITSPDGTNYALLDVSDYLIKVFSSNEQLLNIIPKESYPLFIDRWLDNKQIELTVAKGFPTPTGATNPVLDITIVNPFTNDQKLISSNYPDIDGVTGSLGSWDGGSRTEYDATLTRVVYRSSTQDGYGYTLWDMVNKKKLVQIITYYVLFPAVWSPDYSRFLITGQNREIYTVTRDGKVVQMTHLSPDSQTEQPNVRYVPEKYSWSPDGRYVAFWLLKIEDNPSSTGTFAILNTMTGEITDYCISAGFVEDFRYNLLFAPVWSPDGKDLVINANMQKTGNTTKFNSLFIDLEDGSVTKIGENLSPAGWLVDQK
jgi:hypothetical protein